MQGYFLTEHERERQRRFPDAIPPHDVSNYFTLSETDRCRVHQQRGAHNRLGFALQLCALRYLGFAPDELTTAPVPVVTYVAEQIQEAPDSLAAYGQRAHTRTDHLQEVMAYAGFRKVTPTDWRRLRVWLTERALEHEKPTLLLQLAGERLRREKIVRPGITRLERLVLQVRQDAQAATYERVTPLLTDVHKQLLDRLLIPDNDHRQTPLVWLRQAATSNTPQAILAVLEKLIYLSRWPLDEVAVLTPNRLKFLAQVGHRSHSRALLRLPEERRYPILLAFWYQARIELTDEAMDLFDHCLGDTDARASRDLAELRAAVAQATNEKVRLFSTLGRVVLDQTISDTKLRAAIYQQISREALQRAVEEAEQIARPEDDNYFDFLALRYSYLRQFIPAFLAAFAFQSNMPADPLLNAVAILRHLNDTRRRAVPEDAPLDFIERKWLPYVVKPDGHLDRHYYELCVLWALRHALRAGNVWLEASRRYANPETYLIPKEQWPALRSEVCQQVALPEEISTRFTAREQELAELFARVDPLLAQEGKVRMEEDNLVISPLAAEDRPASAVELEHRIEERLPYVDLSELLIEVDSWTSFSQCFEHAAGSEPRTKNLQRHLYAALLGQGCNIGLTRMAQSAEASYQQLAWCNTWYLREETLKAASTQLVNFHYHQPLSRHWGGGTLSSSDGQRFPVSGKVRNAVALPRYFGYGRGVTFYTWTSDQFSQYGTKVIPATMRDATYVLDAILDNETELPLVEHTTDTAGYTDIIFALFDLLGMQFAPRLRDIGSRQLYRLDRASVYPNLKPLLKGRLRRPLILSRWDDMVRMAGSLKLGWVSASLFISKLQAYPRRNALALALQEYGRLIKTIFILRYLEDEAYRRRINAQLNKGEALHALREFLFFANKGTIRRKQEEEQTNQAGCLNLLTNAVVVWNTVYMAAVIDQLRAEGYPVRDEDIAHLSPARFEHVNPYGKYAFEIDNGRKLTRLRPLRVPARVA
jgi:TnpA family transposase